MKATIKIEQEIEIKTLHVFAGVRYWEDATVNGVKDTDGSLIPCRKDFYWCPEIDITTGQITNWIPGVEAKVHYKVCDDGTYKLLDENGIIRFEIDGYVPSILDLYHESFGDYIILNIDANGMIKDWNTEPSIKDFQNQNDEY